MCESGSEVDAHTGTVGGLCSESVHLWLISLLCESVSLSLSLSPPHLHALDRFRGKDSHRICRVWLGSGGNSEWGEMFRMAAGLKAQQAKCTGGWGVGGIVLMEIRRLGSDFETPVSSPSAPEA